MYPEHSVTGDPGLRGGPNQPEEVSFRMPLTGAIPRLFSQRGHHVDRRVIEGPSVRLGANSLRPDCRTVSPHQCPTPLLDLIESCL
jgi:hypothetical protein